MWMSEMPRDWAKRRMKETGASLIRMTNDGPYRLNCIHRWFHIGTMYADMKKSTDLLGSCLERLSDIYEPYEMSEHEPEFLFSSNQELIHSTVDVASRIQFEGDVVNIKDLLKGDEIGKILYMYSQRLNLGKLRKDENVLWSLAPHDISVILYLIEDDPVEVIARGEDYLRDGIEDVIFLTEHDKLGIVHLNDN